MGWQATLENEQRTGGGRFSFDWYKGHAITQQLLSRRLARGRVCDVACGLGVRSLAVCTEEVQTLSGVDSDPWAIEFARGQAAAMGRSADFQVGSFYDIPFAAGSFDTVLFLAAIEHAAFPVKALRELLRITAPGGRIVISVTEHDYHADPDHKSSFSEAGLRRLLGSFGDVDTWVSEKIVYAVLSKREPKSTSARKRLIYVDMRSSDTYTSYWDQAFGIRFDLTKVSLGMDGYFLPGEEGRLERALPDADILHFGTGAIRLERSYLEAIRQRFPRLLISKWWGDVDPDRYVRECDELSPHFDTLFLSVSNYVGKCAATLTQIHLNCPGVLPAMEPPPPAFRPWDVCVFANAYSPARLEAISACLPAGRSSIWFGDGSPLGRLSREASNRMIGLARISLNIVDPNHLHFRHWFSARVPNALAAGCAVVSSPVAAMDSVLTGVVTIVEHSAKLWNEAIDGILGNPEQLAMMSERSQRFCRDFLSYERAVETIECAWGA